jgi:hypothetical protein
MHVYLRFLNYRTSIVPEPTKVVGRARGGAARALKLTAEQRREIAKKAAAAKKEIAALPKATHGSEDHPLKIGDVAIPCYVLEDGRRVLTRAGLQTGIGMSASGAIRAGEQRLALFMNGLAERAGTAGDHDFALRCAMLATQLASPIRFRAPNANAAWIGYEATILADLCDAILAARANGFLTHLQEHIAQKAEVLVRGFARVGIIALIDEATGYQRDREKDALAKILEAFVAKELQPYMKTFPNDYYEELFRLYNLPYPPPGNKSWRPGFLGNITNDVVYNRLAPELLPELKKLASKHERRSRLHQWLSQEIGHPKLREHLASIVAILKLSRTPAEFQANVDRIHPPYNRTGQLDFSAPTDVR